MNPRPETLLELAREHFDSLPEELSSLDDDYITQLTGHALQAIVLSAAAVESAINLKIALPVTSVTPADQRPYFSDVVEMAYRSSIRNKFAFVIKHTPGLQFSKEEKKAVHALFDSRNNILHPKPEYREYPAESPHTDGMTQEQIEACGGRVSVMSMSTSSTFVIKDARASYMAAYMAVERLLTANRIPVTD